MSDDTKQKSESNLKIMDEIEVQHKPKSFETTKENSTQVGYVHKIVDKVVKDLNDGFIPKLDDILNNSKKSVDQLRVNLDTAKSNLDNLVREVGNSDEGLIKKLNDLRREIEQLKSKHLVMET
ncbi:MAG: hypothetical protein ACR5KV_05870 [Wolbachia sp.]